MERLDFAMVFARLCVYVCSVTAFGYARTKTRSFDEQDRARLARPTYFLPKRSKNREKQIVWTMTYSLQPQLLIVLLVRRREGARK